MFEFCFTYSVKCEAEMFKYHKQPPVSRTKYLNRVELSALLSDLLGVVISGLVDLQQPGGLRQRPQSVYSMRALQLLLLQPFLQVTDVAPEQTHKLLTHFCLQKNNLFIFSSHLIKKTLRPDLHSLPAGAHIFPQHDVVEGGRTNEEEHLLDSLFDEALLHAVLAHDGVEDTELLNDGGDGVCLRVLVDAVGTFSEARWLHARNPLQTLVLQHTGDCRARR